MGAKNLTSHNIFVSPLQYENFVYLSVSVSHAM